MSEKDGTIMDAIADSQELAIFTTDLVKDMVEYKWEKYA